VHIFIYMHINIRTFYTYLYICMAVQIHEAADRSRKELQGPRTQNSKACVRDTKCHNW